METLPPLPIPEEVPSGALPPNILKGDMKVAC